MAPATDGPGESLAARVDGIAAWINELDTRVRAAELATGDESTAKELRRAIEALSKHDPKLEKRLTNRVDVLADRLATLASTVSTTAASLARKDGEIASLRRELEDKSKRIEDLVTKLGKGAGADEVEKLRAAVRAVQAERPARTADARVDALDGKLAFLNERIDTLATTVATTAAGLVGREGEIATLRRRLDDGSARIEQTAAELRRVQGSATLVDRLDALQGAVDGATAGLAEREREIGAVRGRIDEAYARVGTVVAELQSSISTLSGQVRALEALPATTQDAIEARAADLHERVDGLGERVEALATSVESALSGLVDKGAQLSALEGRVDDAGVRMDAAVTELRTALAALPQPGTVDPEVEKRLDALAVVIESATHRLGELETTSSERAESAGARATTLEQLVAEAGERLDAVERERDATANRLGQFDATIAEGREWVQGRLEALAGTQADAVEVQESFRPALEELSARLGSMETEHAGVSSEIARISDALEAEQRSVRAELDALAGALAEANEASADGEAERTLEELRERLESVERDGAVIASEVARTAAFWASELEAIESRLDRVADANGASTTGDGEETRALLAELAQRLEAMERDRQAIAAHVARTSASWESERSALDERLAVVESANGDGTTSDGPEPGPVLAELAERLQASEREREELAAHVSRTSASWESERSALEERLARVEFAPAAPAASSRAEDVIAELRVAIDGLRMRLASSEQELATLVGSRDLATRLDEVTRRLESLERAPIALAGAVDGGSPHGDGRFRLELRAFELRMEHAEAIARENREAVLVQLERLAARIEWRFQRLEAEYETHHPEAVGGGGRVVPLRPAEV